MQLTPAEKDLLRSLIDKVLSDAILIAPDADLRAELAAVPTGSIVDLGGHTFTGNFEIPSGLTLIHGQLRTPNNSPAAIPASNTILRDIGVEATGYCSELVRLEGVEHVLLESCNIEGNPLEGAKRGVRVNAKHVTIRGCRIVDCKAAGADSQAICGWDNSQFILIEDCLLEGAAENIMFGGADSLSPERVPQDIIIRRNVLRKPLEWKGSKWTVKNLFELKAAKRVLFEDNLLENNWLAGQTGYAILLKSVNQDGAAAWSVVEDVIVQRNIIRHTSAGFNLAANPGNNATPASRITIRDNHLTTDKTTFGGDGRAFLVQGINDLTIEHNHLASDGQTALYFNALAERLVVKGNIIYDHAYGIKGDGSGEGVATLTKYAPGAVFEGNLIVTANASLYAPTVNTCVTALPADLTGFGPRA
jgi:hypothetical protein